MEMSELVGQVILLSLIGLFGLAIARVFKIDITLPCLAVGLASGLVISKFGLDTGIRASNIKDVVFFLILPVLIFDAAWNMDSKLLKRWLAPSLLLASVGVLVACGVFAVVSYYAVGYPQAFPWIAALLAGSIVAATDPVAVVASLKKLNAPKDLSTLIEGESLFNDSTAVVLFGLILSIAMASGEVPQLNFMSAFAVVFFGGVLVGVIAGLIAAVVSLFLNDRSASNIVLIFLAFSSFYLAEHVFHVSGIMSVMASAIVTKLLLQEQENKLLKDVAPTWSWLHLYCTMLIFTLMGLVIQLEMFSEQWLAMLIAIVAAIIARAVVVFSIGATTKFNVRPIPFNWQIIMFWGGLRGAVAVALVLSLPTTLPYWWTIQSMVFGVVLFTLIVQGPTTGLLIRRYCKT